MADKFACVPVCVFGNNLDGKSMGLLNENKQTPTHKWLEQRSQENLEVCLSWMAYISCPTEVADKQTSDCVHDTDL